jgi:dephospho-CoA kinase
LKRAIPLPSFPSVFLSYNNHTLATRAFRVGITGKIGSGKSTLSEVFRSHGVTVLDADSIAKNVMQNDDVLKAQLTALLGEETYTTDGLNTSFIAEKIFRDSSLKDKVEQLVHPLTLHAIEEEFTKAKPGEIVALESAILFQTGLDEIFDMVVLVSASDEDVIGWLTAKGKFTQEDIRSRLQAQGYNDISAEDADLVMKNDTTLDEFRKRCKLTLQLVKISAMQNLPNEPLRTIFDNGAGKSGG